MRRTLGPLGLAAVLLATGCGSSDPNSPDTWIKKLNGEERAVAIRKLAEMKAPAAVEPLMAAYKDGRNHYEIVTALETIGDKKAVPTILQALQETGDTKTSEVAARTLLEWQVKDHLDVYLNVAVNPATAKETRLGALKLVAEYPDERVIEPLLPILTADPDAQPIVFAGLAAQALGKVGAAKAVDGLVYCLWLDDHLGRNEVSNCRMALNRIGPEAAVPKLIEVLQRKNRQVEQRARQFGFDKGGLIEAKAAEVLGDMPRPEAVDALIAALKTTDEMPPSIQNDPNKAQRFVMAGVQKVISVSNALAVIGDDRAVDPLLEIAGSKELALEHKLAAVQQLAFLGSQKAVPGLFKILANEPNPRDPVSQGFRIQVALNLANVLEGSDTKSLDQLEKSVKGIQEKLTKAKADLQKEIDATPADKRGDAPDDLKAFDEWQKEYANILQRIAAQRECTVDPLCWGKKLDKGTDQGIRVLAAYRLAQMKDARDTAVAQLVKFAGDEDLTVRNVIFFGLDRLGDESLIDELKKVRDADAKRAEKDKAFNGAVYTADLMIAKLSHKKKKA
jgi:HEAT repeat protein